MPESYKLAITSLFLLPTKPTEGRRKEQEGEGNVLVPKVSGTKDDELK